MILGLEMQKRQVSLGTHSGKGRAHAADATRVPMLFLSRLDLLYIPVPGATLEATGELWKAAGDSSLSHIESFNTHFTPDTMKISLLQEA